MLQEFYDTHIERSWWLEGGWIAFLKKFYKDKLNKFINITNSEMRVLLSLRGVCKPPNQFTILVFLHSTAQVKPQEEN
jgi:hypothetical protein